MAEVREGPDGDEHLASGCAEVVEAGGTDVRPLGRISVPAARRPRTGGTDEVASSFQRAASGGPCPGDTAHCGRLFGAPEGHGSRTGPREHRMTRARLWALGRAAWCGSTPVERGHAPASASRSGRTSERAASAAEVDDAIRTTGGDHVTPTISRGEGRWPGRGDPSTTTDSSAVGQWGFRVGSSNDTGRMNHPSGWWRTAGRLPASAGFVVDRSGKRILRVGCAGGVENLMGGRHRSLPAVRRSEGIGSGTGTSIPVGECKATRGDEPVRSLTGDGGGRKDARVHIRRAKVEPPGQSNGYRPRSSTLKVSTTPRGVAGRRIGGTRASAREPRVGRPETTRIAFSPERTRRGLDSFC
jgi:hypothetical protein